MAKKFKKVPLRVFPWQDEKEQKFIKYIMKDGKRTVAEKIFADTMQEIRANGHMNPRTVLHTAMDNASPTIMVKSARVG